MRIVRGSLPDAGADGAATRRVADLAATSGEPAVRTWTPPRQVSFGRRDVAADGYDRARELARQCGYEPLEREVGGRAVAHTGSTVAFAYGVPADDRAGIRSRYREVSARLEDALRSVGIEARSGEPEGSFCPGAHSLQNGGKIAGVAQRVRNDSALVGGYVVVLAADEDAIGRVLDPVYGALGVPFDPAAVGSVEGAGGPGDPAAAIDAIEAAFTEDRDSEVVSVRELQE